MGKKRNFSLAWVLLIGIILGFLISPGPKKALIAKEELLGPAFWDSVLLNTLEFGWDYGKIYAQQFGMPSLERRNPFPLTKGSIRVSLWLIFKDIDFMKDFDKKVRSKRLFGDSKSNEFLKEAIKARGLVAMVLATQDERIPLSVKEKNWELNEYITVWRNPKATLEAIKKPFEKDFNI